MTSDQISKDARLQAFLDGLKKGLRYGLEQSLGMSVYYSRINLVMGSIDLEPLPHEYDYSWKQKITIKENPTRLHVMLVYNRKPVLGLPSLTTHDWNLVERDWDACAIWGLFEFENKTFVERICFCAPDVVRYALTTKKPRALFPTGLSFSTDFQPDPGLPCIIKFDGHCTIEIEGRRVSGDYRDPSPDFPFHIVIRQSNQIEGDMISDGAVLGEFSPDRPFDVEIADSFSIRWNVSRPSHWDFGFGMGGDSIGATKETVQQINTSSTDERIGEVRKWWGEAIGSFSPGDFAPTRRLCTSKAVFGLLSNTMKPHDLFTPYHPCVPSRSTYASHYLWDACFQSLALMRFRPDLAKESLLLLIHRQEEDGKIPQFSCATWNRPGASQPPLTGWAAWLVYESTHDKAFLHTMYDGLVKNVQWYDKHRDEDRDGLYEYIERLESGWDDSPRWELGMVEPLDLNAFLVVQQRAMGKMAAELGRNHESNMWLNRAENLAEQMLREMYHPAQKAFFDRLYDSHEPIRVLTPACFLPLWAEVPIEKSEAGAIIEKHLLNPDEFWGEIPFPTVAYNDSRHKSSKWWRGPLWPNIAYLMTEVLRIHGYENEWKESLLRLERMFLRNDEPYEYYDSRTGHGSGSAQTGWGCAIAYEVLRQLEGISL